MRKSRLSWSKQERLIEHFVSSSTARCAARLVGVNKSTGAYYFHRLREIIAQEMAWREDEVFGGEIEIDESYFGGKRKGKRGRGRGRKKSLYLAYLRGVVGFIRRSFQMPHRQH